MAGWQFILMLIPVVAGMGCAIWLWGKDDAYRRDEIERLEREIRSRPSAREVR